jgi:alpha-L-fucosidase
MRMDVMKLLLLGFCCLASAQYTPNWDSLDARPLPAWYDQAKFGIFIHWGVFSVPSYGGGETGKGASEWFWWDWEGAKESWAVDFMERNYLATFTYPDFAPQFKAELFSPGDWAQTIMDSGAKYVVLTSKHHEGWTNWPSNTSWNWNAMAEGPHMDLVGSLAQAISAYPALRFGLYFSQFEWFNPVYLSDKAGGFKTQNYVAEVSMRQMHEIVEQYKPQVVWSDGDWEAPYTYWNSTEFLAWLYNESPVKDEVVVNDRWGQGCACHHGGFYTCSDRYSPHTLQKHKWENAMTIDKYSWGFRREATIDQYLSIEELVSELVITVRWVWPPLHHHYINVHVYAVVVVTCS